VAPVFSSNILELPVFSKGIAFKLKYRSEYTAPFARAGNDTTVVLNVTYLRINGAGSYDPDGDHITYRWVLLSLPRGSNSTLIGGTESGQVTLQVNAEGLYIIELTVNDGYQYSLPDTVQVRVINTAGGIQASYIYTMN
jgi:hypothetical protein